MDDAADFIFENPWKKIYIRLQKQVNFFYDCIVYLSPHLWINGFFRPSFHVVSSGHPTSNNGIVFE